MLPLRYHPLLHSKSGNGTYQDITSSSWGGTGSLMGTMLRVLAASGAVGKPKQSSDFSGAQRDLGRKADGTVSVVTARLSAHWWRDGYAPSTRGQLCASGISNADVGPATRSQRRWTVNGVPFATVLWDSLGTRLE